MVQSHRRQRERRILGIVVLSSAAVSAVFGYRISPDEAHRWESVLQSVLSSVLITAPVVLFEIQSARVAFLRRMRRLPLVVFFAIKVAIYLAIIVGGIVLARVIASPFTTSVQAFEDTFRNAFIFSIFMAVFGNLTYELGSLLGFGTLKNFLTGRYVQPRREERVFLLIDMKDSTGLAERLGPVRFHELLNAFFRNIADAALECDAEIHKYVGDEAILTWLSGGALGDCLACPFIAIDRIADHGDEYRKRFGAVPTFRASLHCGEIVAGEMGDIRREIAYVGDTLNVAARLLEHAKTTGHDVLVSADMLAQAPLPADLRAEPLPDLAVRGRAAPLAIAALSRV